MPLEYQKNMRECEVLCRESILEVIRNSMPIEHILRAYMDETTYDDVLEETLEKQVTGEEAEDMLEEAKKNLEKKVETNEVDVIKSDEKAVDETTIEVEKPKLVSNAENAEAENAEAENAETENAETENIKMEVAEPVDNSIDKVAIDEIKDAIKNEFKKVEAAKKPKISFNDTDSVLDMGTNTSNDVLAPKNIERLEEISRISKEREREYDAEDDEDEFDDGPLNIHDDDTIDLGIEDFQYHQKKVNHPLNQKKHLI